MKQTKSIRRGRPSRQMSAMMHEFGTAHQRLQMPAAEPQEGLAAESERIDTYQKLSDIEPIAFYKLDRRGCICELNEKAARLLAFAADWLVGRAFVVFVAQRHIGTFLDALRYSISHSEPQVIEIDLFVRDKKQPVQIALTSTGSSRSVFHHLTVADLTDLKKTERLHQESLANWYSLVHNAPDTIITVNRNAKICFLNKPIWGYSVTALTGTSLLDYVAAHDVPKLRRCLDQAFRFNTRSTCEVRRIDGASDQWYQFSFGTPHGSSLNGRVTPALPTTTIVISEISEHKRTEETLRVSGEQLRDFAARLEAVREEERTRVAREIHDELGQALTVLKLDLSWLQSRNPGVAETRKKLKTIIKKVDDTIESVRRISSELRPSILDNLGLVAAIEWQVSEFRKRTGIRTQFISNVESLDISMEASIAVFRVVQEALTNVMRHAKASRLKVRLDRSENELRVSISDNGIGMVQTKSTETKTLGIIGMKERISRLGGEFRFFSEPGKGVRLDIVIPTRHD